MFDLVFALHGMPRSILASTDRVAHPEHTFKFCLMPSLANAMASKRQKTGDGASAVDANVALSVGDPDADHCKDPSQLEIRRSEELRQMLKKGKGMGGRGGAATMQQLKEVCVSGTPCSFDTPSKRPAGKVPASVVKAEAKEEVKAARQERVRSSKGITTMEAQRANADKFKAKEEAKNIKEKAAAEKAEAAKTAQAAKRAAPTENAEEDPASKVKKAKKTKSASEKADEAAKKAEEKAEEDAKKAAEEKAEEEAKKAKAKEKAKEKAAAKKAVEDAKAKEKAAAEKAEEDARKAAAQEAEEDAKAAAENAEEDAQRSEAEADEEDAKTAEADKDEEDAKTAEAEKAEQDATTAEAEKAEQDAKTAEAEKAEQDAKTAEAKKAEEDAKKAAEEKAEQDANKAEAEKAEEAAKKAEAEKAEQAAKKAKETEEAEEAAKIAKEKAAAKKAEDEEMQSNWQAAQQDAEGAAGSAVTSVVPQKNAVQILQEMSVKARRNKWAEFCRTLDPAKVRGAHNSEDKCPADVAGLMLNLQKKQHWYHIWLTNGCKWSKVRLTESFMNATKELDGSIYEWLTEGQLAELYKDADIGREIAKEKAKTPNTWRPHPECPHLAKATQYWSLVKQQQKKELERIKMQRIDWTAEVDADTGSKLSSQMAADLGTNGGAQAATVPAAATPAAPIEDPALKAAAEALKAQQAAAAEKARQAAERKEAADKRRDEAKAQREADKKMFEASSAGKATAQLKEVQPLLDSCSLYVTATKAAKFIAPAMKIEWQKTFEGCTASMKKNKKQLEQIATGSSEDLSPIEESKTKIEIFKKHRRVFDAVKRAAAGKSD